MSTLFGSPDQGIHIAESPDWMKQRRIAGGMRPISTPSLIFMNFVMFILQPLHSFDDDRIEVQDDIIRRQVGRKDAATSDNTERALILEHAGDCRYRTEPWL